MKRSELINQLMEKRGAFFVSITATTVASMLKTGNPYKNVTKVAIVSGQLNWIYGNAVNNQRAREGNEKFFQPSRRSWGERLKREDDTYTPFVTHKGNYYLELKVQRYISEQYFDENGKEITKTELEPFLKESSTDHQEIEKAVILRDYGIHNINSIVMDGNVITLTD